jgi:hypothetical protein
MALANWCETKKKKKQKEANIAMQVGYECVLILSLTKKKSDPKEGGNILQQICNPKKKRKRSSLPHLAGTRS